MKTVVNLESASISVQKINTLFYAEINSVDEDGFILTHTEIEIPIEKALYLAHSIIKMAELDKGGGI